MEMASGRVFSEVRSIQIKGNIITTAPMIKTRYFSAVSAAPLGSRMRRDEDLFRSICRPPLHVVNEFFGHQPLDHRNQQDDQ